METLKLKKVSIGDAVFNAPVDTPIHCLELLEFCMGCQQSFKKEDGLYEITFDTYGGWAHIKSEYTQEAYDGNESQEDGECDILTHITQIISSDGDVESIHGIDKWTESQLILLIDISE